MKIKQIKISNLGIKLLSALTALNAVLILGYSAFAATDSTDIYAEFTIDSSCNWSGTPFQSALTVADDDVCVLTGIHNTATYTTSITVATDGNTNGVGGTLIVGSDTTDTDIVVAGAIDIQGTAIIGRSGNPSGIDAKLRTTTSNSITVSTTSGNLTTTYNTAGDNYIYAGQYLYVGTSGVPTGTVTIDDDYVETVNSVLYNIYIYSDTTGLTINRGTFKIGQSTALFNNGVITNNSTYSTYYLYVGSHTTDIDGGTVNNYGTFNVTHNTYTDGIPGAQIYAGTFNNYAGAILNITHTIRITSDNLPSVVNGYLMNQGTVNTLNMRIGKGPEVIASPTCTFTDATERVNRASHGLANGVALKFSTTGALPTGLDTSTTYYVINSTTNDFQVSLTMGGAAVTFTGTGSGTHSYTTYFDGGLVDNLDSGIINITGISGVVLNVYTGILNNNNQTNTTSLNVDYAIEIRGENAANRGTIINRGVVDHIGRMYISQYGELNLYNGTDYVGPPAANSSRWVNSSATLSSLYTYGTTSGNNGKINIGDGGSNPGDLATLSVENIYIGVQDATNSGDVINYGKIRRISLDGTVLTTSNVFIYLNNLASLTNKSTGLISTYRGNIIVGLDQTLGGSSPTLTNDSGAQIIGDTTGGTGKIDVLAETNNTNPSILYNSGKILYLTINAAGGTINNYANPVVGDPDDILQATTLSVSTAGIINNEENAIITAGTLNVGSASSPAAMFNQKEGTSAQAATVKTTVTGNLTVGQYGVLTNYDKISVTGTYTGNANPAASYGYKGNKGSNPVVVSILDVTGNITSNGYITVCDDNTCAKEEAVLSVGNRLFIPSTGIVTNNGTINGTNASDTNINVTGGALRSSPNSEFNLNTPGMDIPNTTTATTALIEIAGTITNNRPITTGAGTLCIGTWNGTDCSQSRVDTLEYGAITVGSSSSNGTPVYGYIANIIDTNSTLTIQSQSGATNATTFASISGSRVTAYANISIINNLTTATFNGEVQMAGSAGSIGSLDMRNGSTASFMYTGANQNSLGSIYMLSKNSSPYTDTTLNFGDATHRPIINIIDYQTCGAYNCYLEMNNIGNSLYRGKSIINDYGIINVPYTATNPRAVIGDSLSNSGQGRLNIKDDFGGTTVAFNSGMTSGVYVRSSGRVDVEYTSDTQYASFLHEGPVYLTGDGSAYGISPTDDNRGINVAGIFECKGTLQVGDATYGAAMDVLNTGVVTINGNPNNAYAYIYRTLELDGTLNVGTGDYGSTYVYSTGTIRSGGSDHPTGQTSSNFLLNTNYLSIDASGKISSNYVSSRLPSSAGSGSNGGEGEGRSGGNTPSDRIKFNMDTLPYDTAPYGEAGRVSTSADGYGGGAVRLNVRGSILNNGTISANGATSSNLSGGAGAGGTIIIKHTPTHSSSSASSISGSGTITANGGGSTTSGVPVGGGGKIYIDSIFIDNPDDRTYIEYSFDIRNITAYGGENSADSDYAAAGTIVFMGDTNNPDGTLIVDQGAGRTATSGEVAFIRNIGVTGFDRVEAKNGADIVWDDVPTTSPVVCYELGTGSSVDFNTTYSCSDYYFPDKPAKVYINNSVTGAQTGTEPSGTGYEIVNDSKPVFSAMLLNPQNPAETISKVVLEVDDTSDFGSPVWTGTILLGSTVVDGGQSVDFEYAGPQLAVGTPYYYRVKFLGAADGSGLWNHRDWQNQYQFQLGDYVLITSTCTPAGTLSVTDTNSAGRPAGSNLFNANGDRYGYDSCDVDMTTSTTTWYLKYLKTAANFTNGTNTLTPIDNAGADCSMDVSGNTAEEEYAYNVFTSDVQLTGTVQTNATCSASYKCDASICDNDDKYFNIEASGSEDTVFTSTTGALTNAIFTLFSHINVGDSTVGSATPYQLGTRLLLLGPP